MYINSLVKFQVNPYGNIMVRTVFTARKLRPKFKPMALLQHKQTNPFRMNSTSRRNSKFTTLEILIETQGLMNEMANFLSSSKLINSSPEKLLYNSKTKNTLYKIVNLINFCDELNVSTILLNPTYYTYNLFSTFDEKFKVLFINLLYLFEKIENHKSLVQKTLYLFINVWKQYIFSKFINKSLYSTTDLEFLREQLLRFSKNL